MSWEIALVATFVGIAFSLFYLGSSLDKDHAPLKLLMLLMGLLLLVANFGILPQIIDANVDVIGNTTIQAALTDVVDKTYSGFIYVLWIVVAYFLIYFLYKTVKSIKVKRQERK